MPGTYQYPPPIRLTELVTAIGVDGIQVLAERVGALKIETKSNQQWRYVLDGGIIIGYSSSVVVAGRDELAMQLAAARLLAAGPTGDESIRNQAQVLDLAVVARLLAESNRLDTEYLTRVRGLIDRCVALSENDNLNLRSTLQRFVPTAWQWLTLLLQVYGWGVSDALDVSDVDDDVWLPDVPQDSGANVTISA